MGRRVACHECLQWFFSWVVKSVLVIDSFAVVGGLGPKFGIEHACHEEN